jgi:hypothetical protein
MIVITAFSSKQQEIVTVSVKDEDRAAKHALGVMGIENAKFVRISDGRWNIVFPTRVRPALNRLQHIIDNRAEVALI